MTVILTGNAEIITKLEASGSLTKEQTFQLGTLTEPLVTSLSAMILMAEDKMTLNSLVTKYLPEFGQEGKEDVTIKQLLKHTSGLAVNASYLHEGLSKEEIFDRLYYEQLEKPPGFERRPSLLGFCVLGAIIEKISGKSLDDFFNEKIVLPLGLQNSSFEKKTAILGYTGFISTAEDCWKIASSILANYTEEEPKKTLIIPKPILDEFIGIKARYKLGWDKGEPPVPTSAIGMFSDTGCALWIDLKENKIVEVFTCPADISKLPDYVRQAFG